MHDNLQVRQSISGAVKRNKEAAKSKSVYAEMLLAHSSESSDTGKKMQDHFENLLDIRYAFFFLSFFFVLIMIIVIVQYDRV